MRAQIIDADAGAAPTLHGAVHTPRCWRAATRLLSGAAHDDPAAQHHRAAVWGLWSEHAALCLGWRWRCWLCSGANVSLAFRTLRPPCACAILCLLSRMCPVLHRRHTHSLHYRTPHNHTYTHTHIATHLMLRTSELAHSRCSCVCECVICRASRRRSSRAHTGSSAPIDRTTLDRTTLDSLCRAECPGHSSRAHERTFGKRVHGANQGNSRASCQVRRHALVRLLGGAACLQEIRVLRLVLEGEAGEQLALPHTRACSLRRALTCSDLAPNPHPGDAL